MMEGEPKSISKCQQDLHQNNHFQKERNLFSSDNSNFPGHTFCRDYPRSRCQLVLDMQGCREPTPKKIRELKITLKENILRYSWSPMKSMKSSNLRKSKILGQFLTSTVFTYCRSFVRLHGDICI